MKLVIKAYWKNSQELLFQDIGKILTIVLLIVGATLSWIGYDEYRQVQESEYRLLEAHARNADVQVATALSDIEYMLGEIAQEWLKSRPLERKAFVTVLERHKKEIPELGTLFTINTQGHISHSTDPTIVGRDISQESYFANHLNAEQSPKMFMSRPDKNLLGIPTIIFSLPIIDINHRFLGVVGITIGFNFFPKVLQAINPDDSASMSVIFNRDGDLMYRRENPEKFFGNNITQVSTVLHEHRDAGTQVTRHIAPSAHNGKTRLFLIREVGDTGIGLILSRQLDEVFAKWRRNVVIYALIFLFISVVVILLVIFVARSRHEQREREIELATNRERLQKIKQQQMLSQERQRLMQDMHDGLGSSLTSALRVIECGKVDEADIMQILKSCIDDLKLAIDSMEPVDADLLLLLATLRFRLAPRLESTGIILHWEIVNVPALNWLDPRNALHILRILQEAFTNIIKHTRTTEIRVITGVEDDWVVVIIIDNGQGFSVEHALKNGGKGLSNQMRRAEAIGATIHWESNDLGTRLTLRLRVAGATYETHKNSTL